MRKKSCIKEQIFIDHIKAQSMIKEEFLNSYFWWNKNERSTSLAFHYIWWIFKSIISQNWKASKTFPNNMNKSYKYPQITITQESQSNFFKYLPLIQKMKNDLKPTPWYFSKDNILEESCLNGKYGITNDLWKNNHLHWCFTMLVIKFFNLSKLNL